MRYFLVPKTLFEIDEIKMYGKVTGAALCKFANSEGECFPSRKTIAACGRFSVSTYNKYIIKLLESGIVTKESRWRKNMSQTSNLFKVHRNRKDCFPVRNDIFNKGLSASALCVYICLCRYIAEDNCCRVSQRTISQACSMSLVSVVKAVKELRQAGLLETFQQTNISNNGNYVLLYRLTDGKEYKNVTRKRIDVEGVINNDNAITLHRNLYAVEKQLNRIAMPKMPPVQNTHPPYIKYTPLELCLY